MEKGIFVSDIKTNTDVSGLFRIDNPALAQSKNGSYWRFTLSDVSGSVEARIWHPRSADFSDIPSGVIAKAIGKSSSYRDQIQVIIEELSPIEESMLKEINPGDFISSSSYDIEEMYTELMRACLDEFHHPPLRKFISGILTDPQIKTAFKILPAAKSVHHAWVGGLLEHTLSVFKLCRLIADQYVELDRQILLAGAIIHDIGKIREFSGGLVNDYTDEGKLIGHMISGVEIIAPFLEKSGLEAHLGDHLKHLIISHHGELQYGSAKTPRTAEAFALHYADNLDAKLATCRSLLSNVQESGWSAWKNSLDGYIFKPRHTPAQCIKQSKTKAENQCLSLLKE